MVQFETIAAKDIALKEWKEKDLSQLGDHVEVTTSRFSILPDKPKDADEYGKKEEKSHIVGHKKIKLDEKNVEKVEVDNKIEEIKSEDKIEAPTK